MKIFNLILFLCLSFHVLAQDTKIEKDSITNAIENSYIENHNNQLNIKFDVTNDQVRYFMPYEGEKANIKTNLSASLGFVFSYKFASVRLGIRPGLSNDEKENKGETDFFRIKIKLLFDKWRHRFEYNYNRGFYINNTDEFELNLSNSNYHIQFPNLTTNIIAGSSHHNINKNYSVKAVESNTEIQLKSAGTFVVGVNYSFYNIAGANIVKNENDEIINKTAYKEYTGFSTIFNGGYHHTFVLHKYWYVNMHANPGVGLDFYKTIYYTENNSEKENNNEVFFALSSGIAAGYNGQKYYFGLEYNYTVNSEKIVDETINLQPVKDNFHVFIGYRFKAPKQVRKPVEFIENKVPILKDGN